MKAINLVLRFALEVAALAALAHGGWHLPGPVWLRILTAVALPLAGAMVWGQWVAPKARRPLADPLRLLPEWVVFGGAAVALTATGHIVLAVLLAALAAANRLALHLLGTTTGGEPA
jgi:TRAP-type C4-dicarboxylate transport system permease small subunit